MNAPWSSPAQSTRQAFAAYLCDQPTLDAVRQIASGMGWPPEQCHDGGLRAAVQALAVSPSPAVLLVDLAGNADPLDGIHGLAEVCEPGTLVLAIGEVNDVTLYRDLLSAGIHDYLLKPLPSERLREALAAAYAVAAGPRQHEGPVAKAHLATAVIGIRGGAGASTVATSLAWLFSTEHAMNTALLDLDLYFGTAALAFDVEPGRGLADAIDDPARIDGLFLERAMVRSNPRLALLAAEMPLDGLPPADLTAFLRLEEEFRTGFEASVIDVPRRVLVTHHGLVAATGAIVLVTDLTLAAARDTIRILAWLRNRGDHGPTTIVANKVRAEADEISRQDFEASVESRIAVEIPYDAKAAATAAKLGKTLAEASPASKAAQALRGLAAGLAMPDAGAPTSRGRFRNRLLGRFGELRLPKKR